MGTPNCLLLQLGSNIAQYEITVYDGYGVLRKQINATQTNLCLCSYCDCFRLIAKPLTSGYSTSLYYCIDARCQSVVNLYFNFPQTPVPPTTVNTFTLTDRTYGLPIDGVLTFTQA